jgi:hypothetical protein
MVIGSIVAVISLLVVVAMAVFALSRKGRIVSVEKKEVPFVLEGDATSSIDTGAGASDPGQKSPRTGGTLRDTLESELRDRAMSGKCLICPDKATHAMPRRSLVRSLLDPLFRYYNIVAADRYRIDVHLDVDHGPCLCEAHHHIARAALERKSAEMIERYAQFIERGRYEMLEYERFEIYETVIAHEQEIRARKPQKRQKAAPIAAVVPINDKKAANSG